MGFYEVFFEERLDELFVGGNKLYITIASNPITFMVLPLIKAINTVSDSSKV